MNKQVGVLIGVLIGGLIGVLIGVLIEVLIEVLTGVLIEVLTGVLIGVLIGVIALYVYVNTNKLVFGVSFVTNIVDFICSCSNNIYGQDNKCPSLKFQLFTWLRLFTCPTEI